MKRKLIFVAALVAAAVIIRTAGHFVVGRAQSSTRKPQAPDVRQKFPDRDENDTASRVLAALAGFDDEEMQRNREGVVEYVRREVTSPSPETQAPPEALARFLAKHRTTLRILCADLATHPVPVWKSRADDLIDTPQPDLILMTRLFLILTADGLAEHNRGNDPVAWSDARGVWVLSQSLWARQEVSSVLTALTGSRLLAAIATKLPPPAPAWWNDFVAFDARAAFARALEYESWALRTRADRYPAGEPDDDGTAFTEALRHAAEPFLRPMRLAQANRRARELAKVLERVKADDPCAAMPRDPLPWTSTVQRFDRFLIEREGVAKLLAAEEARRTSGSWPAKIDPTSICRQEQWSYRREGDRIEIAFTGKLPAPQTRVVTPVAFGR